tara:strand:- start:105 stop:356 length:252 start_codon:yes stop_codon:yes gene_type:complete
MKYLITMLTVLIIPNIAIAHEEHEKVKYKFLQQAVISPSNVAGSGAKLYVSVLDTETGKIKICTARNKGLLGKGDKSFCTDFE